MKTATYLGDGVYANPGRFPGEVILTTGCHLDCPDQFPDSTIYLDPTVAAALVRFIISSALPSEDSDT